jgi:hypothetical protein
MQHNGQKRGVLVPAPPDHLAFTEPSAQPKLYQLNREYHKAGPNRGIYICPKDSPGGAHDSLKVQKKHNTKPAVPGGTRSHCPQALRIILAPEGVMTRLLVLKLKIV